MHHRRGAENVSILLKFKEQFEHLLWRMKPDMTLRTFSEDHTDSGSTRIFLPTAEARVSRARTCAGKITCGKDWRVGMWKGFQEGAG